MIFLGRYIIHMTIAALHLYTTILFIYIIAGWFVGGSRARWYVFLSELCDPALDRVRRLTRGKLVIEQFDLSPMLLFVIIYILIYILGSLLH